MMGLRSENCYYVMINETLGLWGTPNNSGLNERSVFIINTYDGFLCNGQCFIVNNN